MDDYDVVVIGASIAGASTATLLARRGARVALVEKRPDVNAFKRICSHYIQPSAVPMLERAGFLGPITRAGGVRGHARLWTKWGWLFTPHEASRVRAGVNLRRERLDPLLRQIAADTPGVDLLLGESVEGVSADDRGTVTGAEVRNSSGRTRQLTAKLTVGADGRDSRVAELADLRPRIKPHRRFAYGAYFEGPPPTSAPDVSLWFLDPHVALAFPTDSGLTLYGCMPTQDRLPEFKADPGRALQRFVADIPDAPPIRESRMLGPVFGKLKLPNVRRGPTRPGLALVGDAAVAADPLFGVGCGWAFQESEWLADSTAAALNGEQPLQQGLDGYRDQIKRNIYPHDWLISDYATGRRMDPAEKLMFSAGAYEPGLLPALEEFATRSIDPARFLPRMLPRAMAVHARRGLTRARRPAEAVAA